MIAGVVRGLAPAIAASATAVLPVPLVGGFAVLLQDEMRFGESELGIAMACFFASAALTAPLAGRFSEAIGPRRIAWLGLGAITTAMLGVVLVASSWYWLAGFMALAGIGHASTLLAVGVLLTRTVSERRLGLAFGVAQAAAPLAALLAGLSLPTVGLTLGWRVAFAIAAVVGVLSALILPPVPARAASAPRDRGRDAPIRTLIPLAIGMALASAGGNSSVVFLVSSAVDQGLSPSDAGAILAIASLVGLVMRIMVGWAGDLLQRASLVLMCLLLALGGAGYIGLSLGGDGPLVLGAAVLAFGGGWGWPGLMLLAVARTNPSAPGAALGLVTLGGLGGAVVGPLAFGLVADNVSFAAAWLAMASIGALAIVMILTSQALIRRARPALTP